MQFIDEDVLYFHYQDNMKKKSYNVHRSDIIVSHLRMEKRNYKARSRSGDLSWHRTVVGTLGQDLFGSMFS